jgi:hypothetical protein
VTSVTPDMDVQIERGCIYGVADIVTITSDMEVQR